MKFCINCKHFERSQVVPKELLMGRCARKPKYNPVTGESQKPYAEIERGSLGTCKPEGQHFVPIVEIHDHRDYATTSVNHDLDPFGRPLKQGT